MLTGRYPHQTGGEHLHWPLPGEQVGFSELLRKSGFARVEHCACRETASPHKEIIDLDNRENESLFVEAYK